MKTLLIASLIAVFIPMQGVQQPKMVKPVESVEMVKPVEKSITRVEVNADNSGSTINGEAQGGEAKTFTTSWQSDGDVIVVTHNRPAGYDEKKFSKECKDLVVAMKEQFPKDPEN